VQRLRSNPRPFLLAAAAVTLIIAFFVVVAPLFTTGGAPSAEIAGAFPDTATVGAPLELDVGLDNVGTAVISPVCVRVTITGPVDEDRAVFQGEDTVAFRRGLACGGSLDGMDTISVKVFLRPRATGSARVSIEPAQGSAPVGTALVGSVRLVSG